MTRPVPLTCHPPLLVAGPALSFPSLPSATFRSPEHASHRQTMSDLGKQIWKQTDYNSKAELKALLESHTDAEVANAIDWKNYVSPAVSESLHAGPHGDSDGVGRVGRVHGLDACRRP